MAGRSRFVLAVAVAAALVGACGGGGDSGETPAPSTFPGGGAQGTGTVVAPTTGQPGGTAPAPDDARPASAGNGKCLDRSSAVVRKAVAGLPEFRGNGYVATSGTEARLGECPDLMYVHADLQGGTGSSPEWILFFDKEGYLGTATNRYTSFTRVVDSSSDAIAVSYRWLNPGDATAGPSGGPVIVTYRLTGRTVTPNRDVPREVFDGGAAPSTTAPTTTVATTSASTTATTSTAKPGR